jgi:CheY-like chemotaxis protein
MEGLSKLITAVASLAWPVVLAVLLYKLRDPIRALIESARGRKFTIKVAGNELTMEEASEQQRVMLSDLQNKLAALEKQVEPNVNADNIVRHVSGPSKKAILWVDDNPKNNSYLVASLEERGVRVDTALSTEEALTKFNKFHYDIVISDMGRPEGDKAGIDLIRKIKARGPDTPVFIFSGFWAASNLRDEALKAGATEITSSGTTLLSALPL